MKSPHAKICYTHNIRTHFSAQFIAYRKALIHHTGPKVYVIKCQYIRRDQVSCMNRQHTARPEDKVSPLLLVKNGGSNQPRKLVVCLHQCRATPSLHVHGDNIALSIHTHLAHCLSDPYLYCTFSRHSTK